MNAANLPMSAGSVVRAVLALAAASAMARARAEDAFALPVPAGTLVVPTQFRGADTGGPAPSSGAPASPWWTLFGDAVLNRLEAQAIESNQDLQAAVARVTEARAAAGAVAADLYPKLSAPIQLSRQRTTNTGPVATSRLVGSGFFPASSGITAPSTFEGQVLTNTYSDFQLPLAVGYEVDLFGRVRHARDQARANAEASLADREGVRLTLAAQVASNYFALRAADSEVAVLTRTVGLRKESEEVQDRRVKGGSASDVDLLRARVETANTEADLVDVVQRRAELENALAELCGQSSSVFRVEARPLDELSPPAVPSTIPAQLMSRRPDLVEAERRIAAAEAGVKAARAQFYPAVSLMGTAGLESSQDNQLVENQSRTWSISGAINIPIFDGGRNASNLKAARARDEEAYAAYRETALSAFREVENALSNLRQRAAQAEARQRALDNARRVFEASQKSYADGGLTYFEVVDAERVLLSAERARVRTLGSRYAATVDLIRATGGGYAQDAGARE